jgi:hypothetical protein
MLRFSLSAHRRLSAPLIRCAQQAHPLRNPHPKNCSHTPTTQARYGLPLYLGHQNATPLRIVYGVLDPLRKPNSPPPCVHAHRVLYYAIAIECYQTPRGVGTGEATPGL